MFVAPVGIPGRWLAPELTKAFRNIEHHTAWKRCDKSGK
jgi:hypothetical protein